MSDNRQSYCDVKGALMRIKNGEVVIVIDDENRENEGDFVTSAQLLKDSTLNFMISKGKGILCCPISEDIAQKLQFQLMPRDILTDSENDAAAFCVSVDKIEKDSVCGVSSYQRTQTIKQIAKTSAKAEDFRKPGHILPLIAKKGGLKQRRGHTEASVELMKLAGLKPAAVIIEIINEDGTMARLKELEKIADKYSLQIITIEAIANFIENNKK